jgi:acetyltransferase-like isoleucine patch superfamily enzyme
MSFIAKFRFLARLMADPDLDALYRRLKEGAFDQAAAPEMIWWRRQAAFLHAHSWETAVASGMKLGHDPRIEPGVIFMGHQLITIGDGFTCSFGATVRAVAAPITIGSQVNVGPLAAIIGANHGTGPGAPMQSQPQISRPVTIADDVWIGAGAIILPGVTVGPGAVIAAGAVVSHDVPARTVVGGVPAKVVAERG